MPRSRSSAAISTAGIYADELHVGDGVRLGDDVQITGRDGARAARVTIGDGAMLEDGVRIEAAENHGQTGVCGARANPGSRRRSGGACPRQRLGRD